MVTTFSAYYDQCLDWPSKSDKNPAGIHVDNQIFCNDSVVRIFSKNVSLQTHLNRAEEKTKTALQPISFSVKGKVTVEWGGSDGVSITGSASGNISDNRGNKAEGEVSINNDGSGSASISASHDEDSNS